MIFKTLTYFHYWMAFKHPQIVSLAKLLTMTTSGHLIHTSQSIKYKDSSPFVNCLRWEIRGREF